MVKFAVCDDEREMADLVAEKLREFYPDECEIKCYVDGKSLLEDSARELFDAFFLDIEMPTLDGFSLAEKIRSDNPFSKIIFVTNHTELAHIGYLYGAFRYVRKFALEEELREAVQSLKREFDEKLYIVPLCKNHNIYSKNGYKFGSGYYMKLRRDQDAIVLINFMKKEVIQDAILKEELK